MKKLFSLAFSSLVALHSLVAQSDKLSAGLAEGSEVLKEGWFVNEDIFSKSIDLPPTIQKVAPVKIASDKLIGNIGLYETLAEDKGNKAPRKQTAENKFDAFANVHNMPIAVPSLIPEMPTLNPMDSAIHYFILKKMIATKD
ncbi:MAG: hypothetical protein RIG77_16250 [Cyclobacteriaceae bacterium]